MATTQQEVTALRRRGRMPLEALPHTKSIRAAPFAFTLYASCSEMSCITSERNLLSTWTYICLNFVFKDLLITTILGHLPSLLPSLSHPIPAQSEGKHQDRKKKMETSPGESRGGISCALKTS